MRFIRLFSFILFLLIAMAFASPGFAQDTRDATTYSQPRLVRGDTSRCQFETVANGENITLTLLNGAGTQGTKKDKSRCKIEFQATIQPEEGWYAYGIQQALDADTQITQNGGTALITARHKFAGKTTLQVKETKTTNGVVESYSQDTSLNSVLPKSKQCSKSFKGFTGKMTFDLEAEAQGDGNSAHFHGIDTYFIYVKCDSKV